MALVNKNMQLYTCKADIINTFLVLLGNAGHLTAQLGTVLTPSKHQAKASKWVSSILSSARGVRLFWSMFLDLTEENVASQEVMRCIYN